MPEPVIATRARLSVSGAVATITLDNGPGNRIDFAMRQALKVAVETVAKSDVRVLVLRGAGRDFCRGGDVREWVDVPSDELEPRIAVLAQALDAIRALPIPTLAVVQGACMGGGFEIALSCDMIIAARDARFRFPEARSGILTLQGGAMLLAERVGRAKALELVLLAREMSAEQLAAWNVVNHVVDPGELDREAADLAYGVAAVPPGVARATKTLLTLWRSEGPTAVMRAWYPTAMPLFDDPDTRRRLRETAESLPAAAG